MAFLVDEAYLPATLTAGPMTDDEFADFCAEHPDLSFEMTAEGELLVMPPTYNIAGLRNNEVAFDLKTWAKADGRGLCCDSSTGIVLPNGARRSPDASWVLRSRVAALEPRMRSKYWHLCPDFVIEIRSATDRLKPLRATMAEYIANGAKLGWLLDPENRTVEIYRPGREPEILAGVDEVRGEGPVDGFVLDLRLVWDPLAA